MERQCSGSRRPSHSETGHLIEETFSCNLDETYLKVVYSHYHHSLNVMEIDVRLCMETEIT